MYFSYIRFGVGTIVLSSGSFSHRFASQIGSYIHHTKDVVARLEGTRIPVDVVLAMTDVNILDQGWQSFWAKGLDVW